MTDDVTDWRELHEFNAIDMSKSYVLSWDTDSESLLIDLDLFLCPNHAFYEKPRPAEKACFRPATLEFPNCSDVVSGADRGIVRSVSAGDKRPTAEQTGEIHEQSHEQCFIANSVTTEIDIEPVV